jgi:hypothetical protein
MKRAGLVFRINGHNVRVLQLGQALRFAAQVGGDLQSNKAVRESRLPSEEYAAERSVPEFTNELEAKEYISLRRHFGKRFI